MNIKVTITLLLWILALPLNAQDIFKLKLVMDTSNFIKGEPVQVGISIINNSNNTVNDNYLGSLQLLIFNDNGDEVQRSGAAGDYWGPTKNVLSPNEEDYFVVQLNDYFGKSASGAMLFFQYFDVGNYTLQATFFPKNPNINKVKHQITFKISEPDKLDLLTFNKLLDILENECKMLIKKENVLLTVNELINLYDTYPNTVYSPYILEMLEALYYIPLKDIENKLWAQNELIEKYSWSSHVAVLLEAFLSGMKKESDRITYVKKYKL